MQLPELHIWRNEYGIPSRIEYVDGDQRIEVTSVRRIETEQGVNELPSVRVTFVVTPIYHDPPDTDAA